MFFQCSDSGTIINLDRVDYIKPFIMGGGAEVHLRDGPALPISRPDADRLLAALVRLGVTTK